MTFNIDPTITDIRYKTLEMLDGIALDNLSFGLALRLSSYQKPIFLESQRDSIGKMRCLVSSGKSWLDSRLRGNDTKQEEPLQNKMLYQSLSKADVNYYTTYDASDEIVALINTTPKGRRVSLIGHSWGGDAAAKAAAHMKGESILSSPLILTAIDINALN